MPLEPFYLRTTPCAPLRSVEPVQNGSLSQRTRGLSGSTWCGSSRSSTMGKTGILLTWQACGPVSRHLSRVRDLPLPRSHIPCTVNGLISKAFRLIERRPSFSQTRPVQQWCRSRSQRKARRPLTTHQRLPSRRSWPQPRASLRLREQIYGWSKARSVRIGTPPPYTPMHGLRLSQGY